MNIIGSETTFKRNDYVIQDLFEARVNRNGTFSTYIFLFRILFSFTISLVAPLLQTSDMG